MDSLKGRLLLVLAVAAMMLATVAGPAMARDNDRHKGHDNIHKFHKANFFDHRFDRDFDNDFFFANDFDDDCIGVSSGFDCIGVGNDFDHGNFFWPWWSCWQWSDVFEEWRWECN